MILPDVNLLVYAYNRGAPEHAKARDWLETVLNGKEEIALSWVALMGFVRLLSNPRVVTDPVRPEVLLQIVQEWLSLPPCRLAGPGARHPELMSKLFKETGAGPQMVTDVHLAALAIEHNAVLYSNDRDFLRFSSLKVKNPLA